MVTEKRLIDANALIAKFKEHRDLYAPSWEVFKSSAIRVKSRVDEIDTCMADVINCPTVDAVEEVHGVWMNVKETEVYSPDNRCTFTLTAQTCSVCNVRIGFIGAKFYLYDDYCPNCGAKMDGDGNET